MTKAAIFYFGYFDSNRKLEAALSFRCSIKACFNMVIYAMKGDTMTEGVIRLSVDYYGVIIELEIV